MSTTLRDGSSTDRPQLDRLFQSDPRNADYPISKLLTISEPESKTWTVPTLLDQGQEGACVGFAWTHSFLAQPSSWDFAKIYANGLSSVDAAERFARTIYWDCQRIDEWPGGEYPGAAPQYAGTSVLAAAKLARYLGYITEYRWADNVGDAARAIAEAGPAVLGTLWYQGMETPVGPDAEIFPTGRAVGGHCIVVNGVDFEAEQFIATNSWGERWGKDGTCRISFASMGRLLIRQGEICVPVGRRISSEAL